jgi:hypothetical protein
MPLLIPLDCQEGEHYQSLFRQSQRSYVRACRRKGVVVTENGIEGLAAFLELLTETHARLGSLPTHTAEEIETLLHRWPARIRIWSAHLGEVAIASVLLFVLNRNICNTFYICDRASHRAFHGLTVSSTVSCLWMTAPSSLCDPAGRPRRSAASPQRSRDRRRDPLSIRLAHRLVL